jgi:hypothetical protein
VDNPTVPELIGVVVVLGGLGFSCWAMIDDIWDLVNVYRYGDVGGPRWVAASGHLAFNATMLAGWLCFLYVIAVAVYLPSRTDEPAAELGWWVGWARLGFVACVLAAQVHQRTARLKLRRLPLEAWERMVVSLDASGRELLMSKLLRATDAGRQMGHLVAGELQLPVALLDELSADPGIGDERRAAILAAQESLLRVNDGIRALHQEVKGLEHVS